MRDCDKPFSYECVLHVFFTRVSQIAQSNSIYFRGSMLMESLSSESCSYCMSIAVCGTSKTTFLDVGDVVPGAASCSVALCCVICSVVGVSVDCGS